MTCELIEIRRRSEDDEKASIDTRSNKRSSTNVGRPKSLVSRLRGAAVHQALVLPHIRSASETNASQNRQHRTRRLGNVSLVSMATGFVTMMILTRTGVLTNRWWDVLTLAFEAGVIGGLADWYAVTALFREIRVPGANLTLPLLTKHSNIILRNRQRITDNICEMVQNKWLSTASIEDVLRSHPPAQEILLHFDLPEGMARLMRGIREILSTFAKGMDRPEVIGFLDQVIRARLRDVTPAKPLSAWLTGVLERGDQSKIWDVLLGTFENAFSHVDCQDWIATELNRVADKYARKGFWKWLGKWALEKTGAIDYDMAARMLLNQTVASVRKARIDPTHPIRQKLDSAVLAFAQNLSSPNSTTRRSVDYVWSRVVENAELSGVIDRVLTQLVGTVTEQASSEDTALMRIIRSFATRQLLALRQSPERQAQLNLWISKNLIHLLEEKREWIGEAVRKSLSGLSDEQWRGDIEDKVADDLQWIRVNGAIVGSLVGLVIAVVKCLSLT